MAAKIIPFPAGRVDHSVDVDRSVTEPAIILILPVVRVERDLVTWNIFPPIVSEATARQVRASMRRLLLGTDTGDETD